MNKTVLITGGTSGIGLEIAKKLLQQGCSVAVVGLEVEKTAKASVALKQIGSSFKSYTFDLGDTDQIRHFVQEFRQDFSNLDLLINNAGYATYETFEESSFDEITNLMSVNFMGHVLLTKLLLPLMIAQKAGRIVNIASVAGKIVITPNATYGACKHAIIAWSRALSYELHDLGIAVQVFCPGRVDTDFFLHPTFLKREVRSEMKEAMSAPEAAQDILDGIETSNRFLFYLPKKFRFISWCYNAVPFVQSFFFNRMMIARIRLLNKTHTHLPSSSGALK